MANSDTRLAIVGSVSFVEPGAAAHAYHLINWRIDELHPAVIISGGAPGIDSAAETIARRWGYSEDNAEKRLIIHRPKNFRWKPDGFQDRNLLIAQDCTHLLAIRCKHSATYGSGWTADRAQEMGRTVWRELL